MTAALAHHRAGVSAAEAAPRRSRLAARETVAGRRAAPGAAVGGGGERRGGGVRGMAARGAWPPCPARPSPPPPPRRRASMRAAGAWAVRERAARARAAAEAGPAPAAGARSVRRCAPRQRLVQRRPQRAGAAACRAVGARAPCGRRGWGDGVGRGRRREWGGEGERADGKSDGKESGQNRVGSGAAITGFLRRTRRNTT